MSGHAVELRGVEKRFGSEIAIRGIDLDIEVGEFVALLGPSGCGKTTTLRMIAGLEDPTAGEILIKGRRINDIPVHYRNIGMVFQNNALFPHRTAFGNIAFGLKTRKVDAKDIQLRVQRALEIVRLPGVEQRFPQELSGGQQQRIAIARAIVIEPDLLLLDEPLSALDANLREEMRSELKRIQNTLGITTLFVTHDQSEALSMADRIVLMNQGRIEQIGMPDQLYNAPCSEFAAKFFGHVNQMEGVVIAAHNGASLVRLGSESVVRVSGLALAVGRARLLLRAERARVVSEMPDKPGISALRGSVMAVEYFGMLVRYVVETDGTSIQVLQAIDGPIFARGARVCVAVPDDAWMVL